MNHFRTSEIWSATLKSRNDDPFASSRDRLRAAYEIFWERGVKLAQRISTDLPGLTLHDEAHLAALWDRADQLTGHGYKINPLEAFVFGGAVLLHDAGHAVAAYEGGLPELKRTLEYRDAVAAILRKRGANPPKEGDIDSVDAETVRAALFMALRRLHAQQAEVLAARAFNGNYLIEDKELRDNLAQLIGGVAASHHWDRTSLGDKVPNLQGPPGFMPREWSIQGVKIACLLRCADAIQIDQRRAPAFAFAIHAPQGQSELHWLAQQLAQPQVRPDKDGGPGSLAFTSQRPFTEDKADAWWIAHDLVKNANDELQGCYQIMKDFGLPAFTVDRVAGAESPLHLERFIRTAVWRPVSAEVRVTSVEQIVGLLGGAALYGRDVAVPLRELIQNASDAVRARRRQANDPFYQGKVVVSLSAAEEDGFWQLIVEDDGIGMAEHILAGPLIEFGKSFWTSEEAQSEFPGLVSSNLRQTGRFGIGFFSTLMVAKRIVVTSRRWDAGHDTARSLTFREGLRLRPLISTAHGTSLNQFSTRVALQITTEDAERLLTALRAQQDNLKITLKELVAHLCPCLDCDVLVSQDPGQVELAHSGTWYDGDPSQWAREIVFADRRADHQLDGYIAQIASLLRVVEGFDGEPCGRAAIAFGQIETGIGSVGGLTSSLPLRAVSNFSMSYVGALGFEPDGIRRGSGAIYAREEVQAWASEQARLLSRLEISAIEKYLAAMNVAEFGGDPTPIATILINRQARTLASVYDMLAEGKEIFAAAGSSTGGHPKALSISQVLYWSRGSFGMGLHPNELDFAVITMEAWSGKRVPDQVYHQIPIEEFPTPSSFLSCLERYACSKTRTLKMELTRDVLFAHFTGEPSPRDGLLPGTELRGAAIRLRLV